MAAKTEDQSQLTTSVDDLFTNGIRHRYGDDGTPVDDQKAREYFTEAARQDHSEAQLELAWLLFEENEDEEAQQWVDSLMEQGFGPAIHYHLVHSGFDMEEEEKLESLFLQASEWYESPALAGDPKRQFEFSEILFSVRDQKEGFRWLIASAEQDYSPACYRLGHKFLRGKVSENSTQQGIYWMSRAADLGGMSAYEVIGDLYLLGHAGSANQETAPLPRIAPDKLLAITWFERGIAKGWWPLAYKLGRYYLHGKHLDQDLVLAEKWLLLAAHKGNISAQHTLGDEYASGVRFRQDTNAAIHWLKLAAEFSKSVAFKLAEIFADGEIVPRNFDEALMWLRHATESSTFIELAQRIVTSKFGDGRFSPAETGAAELCLAQMVIKAWEGAADADHQLFAHHAFRLAKHYDLGAGVERNMDLAICWYRKSAQQGLYGAKKRLKELEIDWELK